MNNRKLIIILCVVSGIILVSTVCIFLVKFHNQNISNDIANWGQFGDYFGGVLNPLLALINLVILAILSIRLVKIEDDRNKWTIKELARPYLGLVFEDNKDSLTVVLSNCGMGPLLFKKICIKDDKQNLFSNFKDVINTCVKGDESFNFTVDFFSLTNNHGILAKDKEMKFLHFKTDLSKKRC